MENIHKYYWQTVKADLAEITRAMAEIEQFSPADITQTIAYISAHSCEQHLYSIKKMLSSDMSNDDKWRAVTFIPSTPGAFRKPQTQQPAAQKKYIIRCAEGDVEMTLPIQLGERLIASTCTLLRVNPSISQTQPQDKDTKGFVVIGEDGKPLADEDVNKLFESK
jgi:hypothetical protein